MKKTLLGTALACVLASAAAYSSAALAAGNTTPEVPNLAGKILTVNGPIDPDQVGMTLTHEHIYIHFKTPDTAAGNWDQQTPEQLKASKRAMALARTDWVDHAADPVWAKGFPKGWNTLDDFDTQLSEVMEFKKAGGGTIVDVSNFGLSRNPEFLKHISDASGLNVVMGSGWYQKMFHPRDMSVRTVQALTDIIVHDITVGAQNTGIRAGIIGEVGVEGRPLTVNELKSTRASARAARITGAPIMFHMGGGTPAEKQQVLDIVEQEGVDLHRVVMGHNFGTPEQMKPLVERGAYIELDFLGRGPGSMKPKTVNRLADAVVKLIAAGMTDHIMLSHDICTQMQLKKNGGGGFAYIANYLLPALRARGVSEATIHHITVENPRDWLTFVAPQPPIVSPHTTGT